MNVKKLRLIRVALHDAQETLRIYRKTGFTIRQICPLPQARNVRLYNRAYERGLRSFA